MPPESDLHPPIRSFVLRNGRMTSAQKAALEISWPIYGIDFNEQLLDLDTIFARHAPRILEIGTGMGDATAQMAGSHRENDYLAVEVHRPGIGSLMRKIKKNNLSNIRLMSHDIIDILKYQIPKNSFDYVYIFFPDPWSKRKHHKRRLINATFLALLKPALKKHGRLFIATDWKDYAEHIIELIKQEIDIINLADKNNYSPRPKWRPVTKFEQRGLDKGYQVFDFTLSFKP